MTRRYCWRTGLVLDLSDGERCPECGHANHKPTPDQDACGAFVAAGIGHDSGGYPCALPIGHDGPCRAEVGL